jgi:adenosylcobinamide kinase/adenosylcobinamide-phosphate guanylyltransferase
MIVFIGGGSRSGKSRYALEVARRTDAPRAFVATAEALDDEMQARVSAHQSERGFDFETIEEPLDLKAVLARPYSVFVIDCLTLWISNLIFAERDVMVEAAAFLQSAAASPATVIVVTNEVGCGIVPDNELSRRFRDLAGSVNQQAASAAAEAWWMAFGIPVRLK